MSHQRLCNRANWEFRKLFNAIIKSLSEYSQEWEYIAFNYFKPKCQYLGYCPEKHSCGAMENSRIKESLKQIKYIKSLDNKELNKELDKEILSEYNSIILDMDDGK
jgi:thymidylate synthase ThyX